jgi:hypothetical protein
MAATYPGGIYAPRTKQNKAGVAYDAAQPTMLYAEDVVKDDDEIVAIETELGTLPKGGHADVKARFVADEAAMATKSGVETLTNKRITPRVGTVASSATPTPAGDDVDIFTVTALAEAATFGAPTGTPTNGQKLIIRIKDNATARSLAWNAIYLGIGLTLPATTVISKELYLGFIYNSASSKWECVATAQA